MKFLHKSFWVPYDGAVYPTVSKAHAAISAYCAQNGLSCRFPDDDTAEIGGVRYEIYRGYEPGSRGNYGIKCREV